MMAYVFDVDGTLTPSRGKMNKEFHDWFLNEFVPSNKVYLVTGSDYPKTVEQVGKEICESVEYVMNCSGNHIWRHGKEHMRSEWKLPEMMEEWLEAELANSTFPLRTGTHIEHRTGLCNFSIVGRGATMGERKLYKEFDESHEERSYIAKVFNENFVKHGVIAQVAGDTGIDIMEVGKDKAQVATFLYEENITFFGDKMEEGGNDWPLKKELDKKQGSQSVHVDSWEDTYECLKLMVYN